MKKPSALHDLLRTVDEMGEKQKMAAAEGSDTDIFAYYAEPPLVAVNLFHLRGGHIVDRREFFWEDQLEFDPPEFFSSLLKQVYLNDPYIPAMIHVPVEFEDARTAGRIPDGAARAQSGNPHAAARAEAGHDRPGGIEREAQLRAALPRDETFVEGDSESACRMRSAWKSRRDASSVSIFRIFRARTKSPAWWCGKTGG